ncbi:hypothetical protein [Terrabacter carboxydivorans]|uniref:Secreted protein n=1 Tax=Terrabacter carboxydivorans TaxID=619730 RepID=A0ABP5XYI7_9MICO
MKTSAAAPARPLTASRSRLRRLAVVGLVAPVVALAACSGESAVTADPTAPGGTGQAATSAPATSATTSATSTGTDTVPVDKPVSTAINATIKDPDLGHTITASRIVRHFSWPSEQPVGAKSFEIVGVWVTFSAGSRYSASLDPSMLSLVATDPSQKVGPTTEFSKRWGATPLKTAKRAQRTGGWVFFKVNRGTSNALSLAFNRPAYQVSTTDKNIGAKTFTVVLTK